MKLPDDEIAAQWQEHFDGLVQETETYLNTLELTNCNDLFFSHNTQQSSHDDLNELSKIVFNVGNLTAPSVIYNGKKFVFVKAIVEDESKTPIFVFMSTEVNESNRKVGLILKRVFVEFIFITTFCNLKLREAIDFCSKSFDDNGEEYLEEDNI